DLEIVAQYEMKQNIKHNPEVTKVVKKFGEKVTLEDIKNAIKIENFTDYEVEVDEELPNGTEAKTFKLNATIKYNDGSSSKIEVFIEVKPLDEGKPEVEEPSKPEVEEPNKPEVEEPSKPEVEKPSKPEVEKPSKPEVEEPNKPEEEEPSKPEEEEPNKPEAEEPSKAEVEEPSKA
ncbi:Rib/alpha-like domain-containing protein, partial [Histophilus somni]|uniref:Rib/alpha-like domain-containing protein n=1 Tax=Histophilus somni TaxID=731 RepID=UPI00201F7822